MALSDRLNQLREIAEERTGYRLESSDRLEILEARSNELGYTRRELDHLGYTVLNHLGGRPQEMQVAERRSLVQKARVVWMRDAQAGAAVDLMNDFVFGRGIPMPKCADKEVQTVVEEAWEDPDNQLALTAFQAQLALGIDLSIQSNLFMLVFDDGTDGKVKLGVLEHDAVENVVVDPENRLRVLYFVARHYKHEWDFDQDAPTVPQNAGTAADAKRGDDGKGEIRYYAHWRNVQDAQDAYERGERPKPPEPPAIKMGDGKVFHVAINRGTEMAFGHPVFDRLLRWFDAYNSFMAARMDLIQAKSAFVMKRTVKGTPTQLQKLATQAVSRRSALGASVEDPGAVAGPRPGSILNQNEGVQHEEMSFDTGAANAAQDGEMLRAPVSAATRFPQSYFGNAANSSLATATSLELPVLKAVETRQEFFEALVRFFVDRVIERAVDTGRISSDLTPEERAALEAKKNPNGPPAPPVPPAGASNLGEAHEDQAIDEEDTARDLGYEFKMPSPLRRMMTDLASTVMNVARTFDPNNTNMELSRVLLGVILAEALELDDPQGWVEKIFPEGYVDPAVAAAAAAGAPPEAPAGPFGEFGPQGNMGADGQRHGEGNAYGAPQQSTAPENVQEARLRDLPSSVRDAARKRENEVEEIFRDAIDEALGKNGRGQ